MTEHPRPRRSPRYLRGEAVTLGSARRAERRDWALHRWGSGRGPSQPRRSRRKRRTVVTIRRARDGSATSVRNARSGTQPPGTWPPASHPRGRPDAQAERQCRGRSPALRSNPARRHDPLAGPLTLGSRLRWVAAQSGGLDEQISWATAERTAPDLACVIPVGYSVSVWIDGKEKVYGSIP